MKVCSVCQRCYDDAVPSCREEGHSGISEVSGRNPDMIPGYRLELHLLSGRGIDGYRAVHTESGRFCNIKIFHLPNAEVKRFLRDAELAAALFDPKVADVYDFGELIGGDIYVVSENVEGPTLRELLVENPVPELLKTISIVRQAAEALYSIHQKGIAHGAVRPESIVVRLDAEQGLLVSLKDIDFGGVIGHSIITDKFQIDSELDSLRYFAPEQCAGNVATDRADIYSLGIILHEMLAGTPPFDAEKAADLIEQHRQQRPPDVVINNFELRMLVTHSLTESLRKRPELRQPSANAFARQLRHIEQLGTHESTPPPVVAVTPPRSRLGTTTDPNEAPEFRGADASPRPVRLRAVTASTEIYNESATHDISVVMPANVVAQTPEDDLPPMEAVAAALEEVDLPVLSLSGPEIDVIDQHGPGEPVYGVAATGSWAGFGRLAISGALVLVLAVILIGARSLWIARSFPSPAEELPGAVSKASTETAPTAAQEPVLQAEEQPIPNFEPETITRLEAPAAAAASRTKPDKPEKGRAEVAETKPSVSAVEPDKAPTAISSKKTRVLVSRNIKTAQLFPSTIVIIPGASRTNSDRSPDRNVPAAAAERSTANTRPRIVKTPKR